MIQPPPVPPPIPPLPELPRLPDGRRLYLNCPSCSTPSELLISVDQAFCGNDACTVLSWCPTETPEEFWRTARVVDGTGKTIDGEVLATDIHAADAPEPLEQRGAEQREGEGGALGAQ